jgi:hypothetical protein
MNWLAVGLGVLACVANATMDEIRFHWDRLFGKWFKEGTKAEQWFNPTKSWTNKYISKSKLLTLILSGPLVMFTDFWHALKFVVINSVFTAVLSLSDVYGFWEYVVWLVILNIVWGVVFGITFGVYGTLSDKYTK